MKSGSSSKNTVYILIGVLILALLFAVYYYLILPKLNEVEAMESSVSTLNSEIASIHEQIATVEADRETSSPNILALRKKVPQTRDIESIVRGIEEIEAITGTRVESISFNNYDSLVSGAGLVDPNAPIAPTAEEQAAAEAEAEEGTTTEGETPTEETTTDGETEVAETPVSTITPESLPAELKLITLSINVLAPDFETLQEFIAEFEKVDRVVKVDTFNFSLPGEEENISEDPNLEVSSTIQITTFYYEGDN